MFAIAEKVLVRAVCLHCTSYLIQTKHPKNANIASRSLLLQIIIKGMSAFTLKR